MKWRRVLGSRGGCNVSLNATPATEATEPMRNGSEGHRSEWGAPERAKRARVGGASEGMGSPRASEASEGLLTCARVGVRVFRAGAYGGILYLSGFLVVSWYSYYCNRVPHLLMRLFVSEHVVLFVVYR